MNFKILRLIFLLIIKGALYLVGFLIAPAFAALMIWGIIQIFFNTPIYFILLIFDINLYDDVYGLLSDTFWDYFLVGYLVIGYFGFMALIVYEDWGRHYQYFSGPSVTYWELKKALKEKKE
tara:strand:+ start:233 stop:595 length:363 start_codon:yes stop_codon:yes gene_type:complete